MAEIKPVDVLILGKEYRISCPPSEEQGLRDAAAYLDRRMKDIREGGKVIGTDRIAVMAALNIAHDLIQSAGGAEVLDQRLSKRIRRLDRLAAQALSEEDGQQPLI